ncbi:hypothetical protein NOS3756_56810 (plasmid) [Nostoc sp. NIES-3756]|uniref:hypothetical protein n=1 Tax=Nostoc sp. NIES-3756 TaxID=1751286 RepID=UPI00071FEAE9|nr:hypothetical protein [Nostoc sp. NIES-3756]BAT56669.1 hypothetical protein NOS3756_56810 [Nostoc sp. NIES-3756]BAY41657.1 hypothetical protein NIES2111_60530 [Nostoc sp. NIES-2111]
MRNLFGAILIVSQVSILVPSQAQNVRELEQKSNDSVSISSEVVTDKKTTLPAESSNSNNSSEREKVMVSDSNSSMSSVITKPSSRIPISSRIFYHPSMQQ